MIDNWTPKKYFEKKFESLSVNTSRTLYNERNVHGLFYSLIKKKKILYKNSIMQFPMLIPEVILKCIIIVDKSFSNFPRHLRIYTQDVFFLLLENYLKFFRRVSDLSTLSKIFKEKKKQHDKNALFDSFMQYRRKRWMNELALLKINRKNYKIGNLNTSKNKAFLSINRKSAEKESKQNFNWLAQQNHANIPMLKSNIFSIDASKKKIKIPRITSLKNRFHKQSYFHEKIFGFS